MILGLIADIAELALIVACLYLALGAYVRREQPSWSAPLARRRRSILLVLVLAVVALEVAENVLDGGSGPIDEALLLFIHEHVPGAWTGPFEAITFTGSYKFMFPLTAASTLALSWMGRRSEALVLAASVIGGAGVIYIVKTTVARDRPALWAADWYWGSSFPSGHTLAVAAFATAAVLCVRRIWPDRRRVTAWAALVWIGLVGLSRLVIGVHWPTDVLAAACMGVCLPLVISVGLELRSA